MALFRLLAIVMALSVAVTAALWLLTGKRHWMIWSLRLLRVGVIAGLLFFAVLVVERLTGP